eukprot:COSAG01_NODE_38564_length_488_cov_0.784062_1_plen_69_part_00
MPANDRQLTVACVGGELRYANVCGGGGAAGQALSALAVGRAAAAKRQWRTQLALRRAEQRAQVAQMRQ